MSSSLLRVSFDELRDTIHRGLETTGLDEDRARLCARLMAESTCDGVPSHGLNLFQRLITMIRSGVVDIHARAARVSAHGAIERWDGRCGVGALNAHEAMDAAITVSQSDGIGCVGLGKTYHWMRGGS